MKAVSLSVIIPSYNDNEELAATVKSIRASAGNEPEIIVIDDGSQRQIPQQDGAKVFRNSRRIGCGPSRYVGATYASGEYLLIVDSHMRFLPGWYEAAIGRLQPNVLHCGGIMTVDKAGQPNPDRNYYGATWNFYGPYQGGEHKGDPRFNQVLECVWAPQQPQDDYQLAAAMGACYYIQKEWFLHLNALRHLRLWGGDEQELSLKAWLSGGEIRLLKHSRIGHKFREGPMPGTFVMPWHVLYNKLFVAHTCLPVEKAMWLQMKMQRERQFGLALKALHDDWRLVETCRAYNRSIFKQSFQWFLSKFSLAFPK